MRLWGIPPFTSHVWGTVHRHCKMWLLCWNHIHTPTYIIYSLIEAFLVLSISILAVRRLMFRLNNNRSITFSPWPIRHLHGEFYIGIAQYYLLKSRPYIHDLLIDWSISKSFFPFSQFEDWTLFRLDNNNHVITSIQCAIVVYPPITWPVWGNWTSALHNVVIL